MLEKVITEAPPKISPLALHLGPLTCAAMKVRFALLLLAVFCARPACAASINGHSYAPLADWAVAKGFRIAARHSDHRPVFAAFQLIPEVSLPNPPPAATALRSHRVRWALSLHCRHRPSMSFSPM